MMTTMDKYLLPFFIVLLMACTSEVKKEQVVSADTSTTFKYHETSHRPLHPKDSAANPFNGKTVTTAAYQNDSLGWGYCISIDGKKSINQPYIPSVAGKKGFKTKEQALKTAAFVVGKIHRNIFPPTVTEKELDSLGVLR
jgi:hypothetical protein